MTRGPIVRRLAGAPHAEWLCLALLALGLTFPSLRDGRLITQDLTFNYAHFSFVAHQLRRGESPSWNPYADSGSPEIADPTVGFFYPFHLPLVMTLSTGAALSAGVLIHLVLAGACMHLYLGSLSLSRSGRFLGSLVYMLSGYTATHIFSGDLQRLEVYAWTPLLLYLAEEIIHRRQRMGAAILGGLIIACQFFAGDPQTFIYSSLSLVAYAGFRLVDVHRRSPDRAGSARPLILLAIMLLFAGLLSAVQLLPSLKLLALSTRTSNDAAFAFLGSVPPIGLASFFAPRFLGDEVHGAWGELFAHEFYFHSSTFYVGFFTIALAVIALLTRRDRWHVRFFGLLGLGAVWLALGKFGYIYRLVLYIPILRNLRDIENINILIPLSAAVLASFGFDRYLEPGRAVEVWKRTLRILFLATAGAAFLVEITLRLQPPLGLPVLPVPLLRTLGDSAVFVLIVFVISAWLLWQRSRSDIVPAWSGVAVVAFVVIDLLYFGFPIVNAGTGVSALEQDDAVTRTLAQDRSLYRVYGLDLRGMLFGVQESGGAAGLLLARYSEYTNFIQGYPLDTLIRPGGPHGVVFYRGLNSPLVALLNVKYVIAPPSVLQQSRLTDRSRVLAATRGVFSYRMDRVYPRVLDSYGFRVLTDRHAILQALSRPDYDPRRFMILEAQPDMAQALQSPEDASGPPAKITVTEYTANRVAVRTTFARTGFLLLNDVYYPEWGAYLDGHPTTVYRANYLFRAVVVPKGRHDIRFIYRNEALTRGTVVSGLAGVGALLVWLMDRRSRRRR